MKKTDKQVIKELRAENKELKGLVGAQIALIKTHEERCSPSLEQVKKWEAVYKQLWEEYEKNLAEVSLLKLKNIDNEALIKNYEKVCNNYKDLNEHKINEINILTNELNEHKINEINILTKELTLAKIRINKLIDNLK